MKRGIGLSATYTDKLKEEYAKAREMNQERSDFYCCATPERITKRSLKLQSRYVFTTKINDIDPEPIPSNQDRKEYRLQACIIKKAKENSWLLPFPSDSNKKWILIDAERNFADSDKSDVGEGKKLDLLGYEAETKTYIVLELKANRDFAKANKELAQYTSTVEENIIEMNKCYSLKAQYVKGFIVWPSCTRPRKKDNPWGLIEYDEAFLAKDKIESITFKIVKDPD